MLIQFIEENSNLDLTFNKYYEVLSDTKEYYQILNDHNIRQPYKKERFTLIKQKEEL